MDLVTKNLVNAFAVEESLSESDDSVLFEHFANYCVVSSEYGEEFDIEDIHTGGGDNLGIDGIAVFVNGTLVTDVAEVADLTQTYVAADFVFCRAIATSDYDGADISNLFLGVKEFFSEPHTMPRSSNIQLRDAITDAVYSRSSLFTRGNPNVRIYFVTTGTWQEDKALQARIATGKAALEALNIFENIVFVPVDAKLLQRMYKRQKNRLPKTVNFVAKITLPSLPGVQESYLGFLPVDEYLKLITDETGNMLRGLFYDNVRDYQGSNPVNKEIAETLQSDGRDLFILLNNGVTVVAESVTKTGDAFTLQDYQIVNGCQTSHVLYENQQLVSGQIQIPVKLIVAQDADVKNRIVKATNRQTQVKTEELTALTDFQKALEDFYSAMSGDCKLYYERRSQQYRSESGIEKIRIISVPNQIRSFASMFLGCPHEAGRYYGTLLNSLKGRIFVDGQPLSAYYASALGLYRYELLARKRVIDAQYRPFKYHVLTLLRMQAAGLKMPAMTSSRFGRYCQQLITTLQDDATCTAAFSVALATLDALLAGDYSSARAKDAMLLELAEAACRTKR